MRVIAGRLGGRRLRAPRGRTTRPTADRVREALFSMLGDVQGAHVLDLFAGSGALGIEALSRGAARAVFVERERFALEALRSNLEELGIGASEGEIRRGDALGALRATRKRGETYDLVFVDPPYALAQALSRDLPPMLAPVLRAGARVVVESDRRAPLEPGLAAQASRRYGDTTITIHTNLPTSTTSDTEDEHEH
jgi:16S rRNA (guanine966-N2)-methyltransferase